MQLLLKGGQNLHLLIRICGDTCIYLIYSTKKTPLQMLIKLMLYLWNKIPSHIKEATTKYMKKKYMKSYLLPMYNGQCAIYGGLTLVKAQKG
jgi:hypothetical protein